MGDMMWNMRGDFYVFAERRGGFWLNLSKIVKKREEEWERMHPPKNETEEAEEDPDIAEEDGEPKDKEEDDEDDLDLDQKEKEVKEVPQEVLDAIFGKDDDDEEDEEEDSNESFE